MCVCVCVCVCVCALTQMHKRTSIYIYIYIYIYISLANFAFQGFRFNLDECVGAGYTTQEGFTQQGGPKERALRILVWVVVDLFRNDRMENWCKTQLWEE